MTSVKTPIGELRCYENSGGDNPGFSIYFVPNGSEEEINVAMIQPSKDEDSKDKLITYIKKQYTNIISY